MDDCTTSPSAGTREAGAALSRAGPLPIGRGRDARSRHRQPRPRAVDAAWLRSRTSCFKAGMAKVFVQEFQRNGVRLVKTSSEGPPRAAAAVVGKTPRLGQRLGEDSGRREAVRRIGIWWTASPSTRTAPKEPPAPTFARPLRSRCAIPRTQTTPAALAAGVVL
jgi:hypothetical protein